MAIHIIKKNGKFFKLMVFLFAIFLIQFVYAGTVKITSPNANPTTNFSLNINSTCNVNVNDSIYWNGHAFVLGAVSSIETDPEAYNGTLAYNLSLSNYYPFSNPYNFINTTSDTWSTNYSLYYTKIEVDTNFTLFYLASVINQILSGNITSANIYSNAILTSNLTSYYNKTLIDNNFSLYYPKTDIDTQIITNQSYFSTYNSTYASNLDTNDTKTIQDMNVSWLSSYNSTYAGIVGNTSYLNNDTFNYNQTTSAISYTDSVISANNDSWMSTYNATYATNTNTNISNTSYYFVTSNNGTINGINITWLDNVAGYLSFKLTQLETWFTGKLIDINNNINLNNTNAKTYTNENIAGNLSLTLLANGSRAGTGNFNFGNYNLSGIDNISVNTVNFGTNRILSNTTCVKIYGSSSMLEIC